MSWCCRWSLSFSFLHQKPVCVSPYPTSATCSVHLVLLDLTMPIIHLLRSANHGAPHYGVITAGRLCSNKFLSILFSKTSAYVTILARQSRCHSNTSKTSAYVTILARQSRCHSNTSEIIVLYILIFTFFARYVE